VTEDWVPVISDHTVVAEVDTICMVIAIIEDLVINHVASQLINMVVMTVKVQFDQFNCLCRALAQCSL